MVVGVASPVTDLQCNIDSGATTWILCVFPSFTFRGTLSFHAHSILNPKEFILWDSLCIKLFK